MQTFLVIIVLAVAVMLAARYFYRMFTAKENGCVGCPLNDICDKKKSSCKVDSVN